MPYHYEADELNKLAKILDKMYLPRTGQFPGPQGPLIPRPDFDPALITELETERDKLKEKYENEDYANSILSFAFFLKLDIASDFQYHIDKLKETGQAPTQQELFPIFKPQKNVALKREFALNFGGLEVIEKKYSHLLSEKLHSGMTLQQHIDKVRDWFNNLHGETLGNWIKLFAFVQSIKEFSEMETETINFRTVGPGRYSFSIRQDKTFFSFFIRPSKKTKQFTTTAKNKFLKWLHDNQDTIEFPMIINGKVWNVPMKIYTYAENIEDKELLFFVDTNILESEFKAYVSIDIKEIDHIDEIWERLAALDPDFKKYRLNSFVDLPLKFLLTLKQIYNEKGDFKTKNGFIGNVQRLTKENLNEHLGDLAGRAKTHLQSRGKAGAGKSTITDNVIRLLLNTTWAIAKERAWLMSEPKIENGTWTFNINPGYFAKKKTAKRLAGPF
jgi:hypothetical protein